MGYVFQPRIKERLLYFFSRPIAPASLFALTSQAIILLEEDKAQGGSYGWVMTFCPRRTVLTVESSLLQEWEKLSVLLLQNRISAERSLIVEHETGLTCKTIWAGQNSHGNEIKW